MIECRLCDMVVSGVVCEGGGVGDCDYVLELLQIYVVMIVCY